MIQISDATLPISRKVQREQERENTRLRREERLKEVSSTNPTAGQKRKHSDVDESDPKLQEFLEVMQPASKAKTWDPHSLDDASNEPPTKIQAIEIPERESDDEYEAVPKRPEKKKLESHIPTEPIPAVSEPVTLVEGNDPIPESTALDATDDDWLRGRTNRLLDLMDPDDLAITQASSLHKDANPVVESNEDVTSPEKINEQPQAEEDWEGIEDDKPDPVIEAIKTNGRLFVRNLPYSATEDDLMEHFAPYGSLEEVWSLLSFSCAPLLYDEYPDRDSLCSMHVM